MAKFLSRLFRSSSASKNSSFTGSQTSLQDTRNRPASSSGGRTSASLENLASYHVVPKELEKNKLHKASWEGNINKVVRLARPGQLNLKDQHKRTPLHLAIVKGHLDIVKYLIQEGAKLDAVDNDDRTPLIKAVLSGNQNPQLNYQICQVLLNGGAGSYINAVDKQGRNALHYAIDFGNERLVDLLLSNEYCDPNLKDRDQMTPLHLAIKRNSPHIVQLLVSDEREQQADPNTVNRYGQTPLHIAASVGYADIVRLLLLSKLEEPCDPSLLDSQQLTAYQLAKANHQEVCAKLIEEYQERWYKHTPRRPNTASINEHVSIKATNSISMTPAANLQRGYDDTSDESSSITTSKPSKSSPRRMKQSSDQWSDENGPSISEAKPGAQGLIGLFKNNPLQPEKKKKNENSTLSDLIESNPLGTNSKRPTFAAQSATAQKSQWSPYTGIGPVIERTGSDQTSTSMSVDKSIVATKQTLQNRPGTSNPYATPAVRPLSSTKSWSDDTITAPVRKKTSQIKKQKISDDEWDTSDDEINASKSKSVLSNLHRTQPFLPSTNHAIHSNSDEDTFDAELRRLDVPKQTATNPTVQNLVNKQVENGYKVIGLSKVHSPLSEDSSWTSSPVPPNKEPTTKGIQHIVHKQDIDESTWDDSRPLSPDFKDMKNSKSVSSLISRPPNLSEVRTAGVDNLTKMMETIIHAYKKPSTPSKAINQLPLVDRTDSILSENTFHEIDNDEDYEQSWKKKSEDWSTSVSKTLQQLPRTSFPASTNNVRDSTSTKSSINDLNELKENIKQLERNQEDTRELKRQLKEMENKKNDFEKLYKENDQILRDIEIKLEREKNEKHRLESTTKDLNIELRTIRQKLLSVEDDKDSLNQRYIKLKEERDHHDNQIRVQQFHSPQSTSSGSAHDDDVNTIKSQHREETKVFSADQRMKQLSSFHQEPSDMTRRYQLDLEKALQEKTFFQQELNRLKFEKNQVEQEKLEYKTKYDGLQEEIRMLLLDRSKLEQSLTGELQDHMHEKQRTTDDIKKYRTQIERLNIKLTDAEARLNVLQTQNEDLLATKDRTIKEEFESLSQRYPNQQQQQHISTEPLTVLTSTPLSRGTQPQQSLSSPYTKSKTLPRNYAQEHESRLQKDNTLQRDMLSQQKSYQHLNRSFPQGHHDEHYLIENSRQIRSDTERVKSELDRLRQDFDQLVANYEPTNNSQQQAQLHSQIDTFRQFYEQEFRQRQLITSKLSAGIKPARAPNHQQTSSSSPTTHDHAFNGNSTCTACVNSRFLKERLETAIDTSLADRRLQTMKQTFPLPRQASALLTINTTNNGLMSSVEFLRQHNQV